MPFLPSEAAPEEFPSRPRSVAINPAYWICLTGIIAATIAILMAGLSATSHRIYKAELLLKEFEVIQATIVDKPARSGKNSRLQIVYRAESENGLVSGEFELPAKEWDRLELGKTIPIWYSPIDPRISSHYEPREQHVADAFGARNIFAVICCVAGLVGALVLHHYMTVERDLALAGFATIGRYDVDKQSAGGRDEYNITWTFTDAKGEERKIKITKSSLNDKISPKGGSHTILVNKSEWTMMKPWPLFRWIDIAK